MPSVAIGPVVMTKTALHRPPVTTYLSHHLTREAQGKGDFADEIFFHKNMSPN